MKPKKKAMPKLQVESVAKDAIKAERVSTKIRISAKKLAKLEALAFKFKQDGSKIRLPDLFDEAADMLLVEYGVSLD